MTKDDKLLLAKTLQAIERLQFYNLALESLAEKYAPRNWKSLADELAGDERLHPELRDRCRRVYEDLERDDPQTDSSRLLALFLSLPTKGKPN
jgi:hypothetical protein